MFLCAWLVDVVVVDAVVVVILVVVCRIWWTPSTPLTHPGQDLEITGAHNMNSRAHVLPTCATFLFRIRLNIYFRKTSLCLPVRSSLMNA